MLPEGIEVNVFDRSVHLVVAVTPTLAGPAGGLAHVNPIGGLVAGAGKPVRLDKALQPIQAMMITVLPIGLDALPNLSQNVVGQLRNLDPGQD